MNHRGHCTFRGGVPAAFVVVDREVAEQLGKMIEAAVQPLVLQCAYDAFGDAP